MGAGGEERAEVQLSMWLGVRSQENSVTLHIFPDLITVIYFRSGKKGMQLRKWNRALREQSRPPNGVKKAP
jgi:hypothetical protein